VTDKTKNSYRGPFNEENSWGYTPDRRRKKPEKKSLAFRILRIKISEKEALRY